MTEPLPKQHEQNIWQEKLELHTNAARLNGVEVSKILGSLLAESRTDFDEMYAADTVSDYAYEDETRKIDGALVVLAGLQVSGEDSQTEFGSDLALLAASLKQEQDSAQSYGGVEQLELGNRRAAVAYLIEQYNDEILAPQKEIEKGLKPSEVRDAMRGWTNQTIESHNARVENAAGEAIADSPEIQEAQAQINSRYAEQAKQPQPTETVDDARQKVAETFGDTGEKERQAIIGEVARAAKGTTLIYTDIPKDLMTKSPSGDPYHPTDGFNGFGDGCEPEGDRRHQRLIFKDSPEAFLFELDTTTRYRTVKKTVETGGRFKKKSDQIEEQVPDGEIPTMVMNPATGHQEPSVKVAYQFNSAGTQYSLDVDSGKAPRYDTESGRPGNQLFVEVTLPKSVADKLRQGIASSPETAREFAKILALNNGITEQVWDNVVRPPYDQIPNGWEMTIADLHKDTQFGDVRHNVVSQQTVRVLVSASISLTNSSIWCIM